MLLISFLFDCGTLTKTHLGQSLVININDYEENSVGAQPQNFESSKQTMET